MRSCACPTCTLNCPRQVFHLTLARGARSRIGKLRTAPLPELSAWGLKHPEATKVSAATVNKQLGAVQAIAQWAYASGVIPEDTPWSDPVTRMRVQEEQSGRTSFEPAELQLLFAAPTFTKHEFPTGGQGAAAFWLPLLALFVGARQAEIAGLTAADVQTEPETLTPLLYAPACLAEQ
jgi:integrase